MALVLLKAPRNSRSGGLLIVPAGDTVGATGMRGALPVLLLDVIVVSRGTMLRLVARRPDLDPEPGCPWATALYRDHTAS